LASPNANLSIFNLPVANISLYYTNKIKSAQFSHFTASIAFGNFRHCDVTYRINKSNCHLFTLISDDFMS